MSGYAHITGVNIGHISEAMALAKLMQIGYDVLIPFGHDHRYDLVIERDGKFTRVQVKCGRLRNGKIKFAAYSRNNYTGARRRYDGEVELFAVFCPENNKLYLVPNDGLGTDPYLRVDPPKNGQRLGIRWAKDYDVDKLPIV